MDAMLADSFAYCQQLAKLSGRNFYFSFLTLPRPMFRDMCALYAFMRVTDDLGDDLSRSVAQRTAALRSWRGAIDAAIAGEPSSHPVVSAMMDVQRRYEIPVEYLHAVIRGVESDLGSARFETFADLSNYCYHVAGAVGLCCIHIWGFDDAAALDRAVDCGLAFQLTNILRDLREDAQNGRVYLPQEDLMRFGYSEEDLREGLINEQFRELMAFQVNRARSYYRQGGELHSLLKSPGRPILAAMMGIYGRLLRRIEGLQYDVFTNRITLSRTTKLSVTAMSLLRPGRRPTVP
ncbi:MAG: phytoene/squalene synthase family protein [Planctomycetaceae bacterium]